MLLHDCIVTIAISIGCPNKKAILFTIALTNKDTFVIMGTHVLKTCVNHVRKYKI